MKDATVTINYESFQAIKEKADRYEAALKENSEISGEQDQFIESLCTFLEEANKQSSLENKQYFIAKGIKAICKHFEDDLKETYGNLDLGVKPSNL